jgi:hypothetical protein
MATPTETTTPVLTADEKAAGIAKLDGMVKGAVEHLVATVEKHNKDVAIVRAYSQDKKDPKLILDEVIEKNPGNDPKLAKIAKLIEEYKTKIENLYADARPIAAQYKQEDVSIKDAEQALARTKETAVAIRDGKTALKFFESLANQDLTLLLPEVDTTRGLKIGTDAASGIRPTYKKIFIEHAPKEEGAEPTREKIATTTVKDGVSVEKTNTTYLAQQLSSRAGRGTNVTSSEITNQFLASQNTTFDKLTAGVEYKWTFTKDITDSEGKVIETKKWDLIFVK